MSVTTFTHGQQLLPPKELSLFKKCVKLYEQKQHKGSLRCIKQILSNPNFAEHGETLSMKSLILDVTGHHAEAVELSRKALQHDVKSHVCWHIFGMIMRSDRKYGESLKALKMALARSPENPQILRDLALVQAHIRDFQGFQLTRYALLRMKPNNRQAWMGFIVAAYLAKDYDTALKGIAEYRKPLLSSGDNSPELFEVLQFEIRVLEERGDLEAARDKAIHPVTRFLDQTLVHETRGRLYRKLNQLNSAAAEYEKLIARNSEKAEYYQQYEQCRGLDKPGKEAERLKLYDDVAARVRKSLHPHVAPLSFTTGDEFRRRLATFVVNNLRTGLPSLFQTLRPLYSDAEKVNIIAHLLAVFVDRLEKGQSLDGSDLAENPTTVMWTYYFIAHHFDEIKNYDEAEKFIEKAVAHSPTVVELYLSKARILKHRGDMNDAMEVMREAHDLDTADRYTNCKLVKYLMRCGKFEEAITYAGRFTKEASDPLTSLVDMQSLWIEIELAYSLHQRGLYASSLKVCHEIENQFNGFYEDQYDFHSYCMRKATICGYADLINTTNKIRNHRAYIRAAKLATRIYLDLVGNKLVDKNAKDAAGNDHKNESTAEKKARRKANKAKALQKTTEEKKEDPVKDALKFKIDEEACEKFLKPADPIKNALEFLSPLLDLDVNDREFYSIAFELYEHLNKPLILTKIVSKAFARFGSHPDFQKIFTQYTDYIKAHPQEGVAKQVVDAVIARVHATS
uniref:TPR_REGION domain-containing protein n=1 Tax=Panagrellus redivivus TaxID=6233 RepID=A0A7E4VXR6_PANRE